MRSDAEWTIDPATRATAASPDGRVLMHLESGRMSAVNGIGSDIWGHLESGRTVAAIVSELAAAYDAPALRIADDVTAFLRDLEAKGFAHAPDAVESTTRPRRLQWDRRGGVFAAREAEATRARPHEAVPSTVGCVSSAAGDCTRIETMEAFAALLAVDIAIALGGFQKLHRRVERAQVRGASPSDVNATVARVNAAVNRAAIWYPKQALCLPRSAATTWLLRRRGVPAVFVIGVRKLPFYAHAWVEVDGRVVNDAASVAEKFPAIERC